MYLYTKIGLLFYLLITTNYAGASVIELKGFIGKYPISMTLDTGELPKKKGAVIIGAYSYDKYKTPIKLKGNIDSNYNFVLSEGNSNFNLSGGWDCGGSSLSGKWESDNGKVLPVNLSMLHEDTRGISKDGEEYQIVIESSFESLEKPLTFLIIGNNKLEIETDCDGSIAHHSIKAVEVNSQSIHVIKWVANLSGQGVFDDRKITYLHKNGNKIDGGVSGYRFGMFEYSKKSCDLSIVKDELVRICISEDLLPEGGKTTYKEKKEVEAYAVSEQGFYLKGSIFSQRSDEAAGDDPLGLITSVENMDWEIMSN